MSKRGVWQAQKLFFAYCEYSGSSKGARKYLKTEFPKFKDANPWLPVESKALPGTHPYVSVTYLNGNHRKVDLRNKTPHEIMRFIHFLRSSIGRRTDVQVKRHLTSRRSIQEEWTPETFQTMASYDPFAQVSQVQQ